MCDIALLMFILLVFTGVSALLAFKEVRRLTKDLKHDRHMRNLYRKFANRVVEIQHSCPTCKEIPLNLDEDIC